MAGQVISMASTSSHAVDLRADAIPVIPAPALLWRSLKFWIWVVAAVLLLSALPDLIVDYWFFESIGRANVFWTMLNAQLALFAITWLVFCLADYLPIRQYAASPALRNAAIHLGSWSGLFAGWIVSQHWATLLLLRHRQSFGVADPVFGHDIGFYVFVLPALVTLFGILAAAGLDTAFAFLLGRWDQLRSLGLFARRDLSLWEKAGLLVTPGLNYALTLMGASLVGETFLGRYYLLVKSNAESGVRVGAEYLDVTGAVSTINLIHVSVVVELGVMVAVGVALARTARRSAAIVDAHQNGDAPAIPRAATRRPIQVCAALLAVELVFFAGVVIRQHVFVRPNEPSIQLPYIRRHMDATLAAYRLNGVQSMDWTPPASRLSAADIRGSETMKNAPVLPAWVSRLEEPPDVQHLRRITLSPDLTVYGPMLDIFKQEQGLRPYYDVLSIDAVRYEVDGRKQMFASATRELPSRAFLGPKEWLRHWGSAALMYTHGYGLIMSPVNATDPEGRPTYSAQDIPARSAHREFASVEPRIYYGEGMKDDYVLTNIRHLAELDYPDDQFRVTGEFPRDVDAGIKVDSLFKRVVLALKTRDLTAFLFSSFIDYERTRVHFYRTPMRRAARLAPFLFLDSNPYAFISGNRTQWMVNGLTTTDMYPYSLREVLGDKADERAVESVPERLVNYAEDSVKVTIDAFSGDTRFYQMTDDPIIRAWAECFPGLFEPIAGAPEPVRAQLTYPLQWFHLQFDDIYKRYHMRDPIEFYNVEDLWDDADEVLGSLGRGLEDFGTQDEATFSYEGYHALVDPADLPAGAAPGRPGDLQFAMFMPFTPEGQRNLRSLIVAFQDPGSYGRIVDLRVPQGVFVPGPEQADTIIDTDAQVNQQIALWIRHASEVIRGHTILVPVKGDIVYVEPLWISSIQNHLPEVKLYSVVYQGRCAMATTLEAAIQYLDVPESTEQRDSTPPWFGPPGKEGK
jgi:uncharacterized membrane protein (UPF0182 family)